MSTLISFLGKQRSGYQSAKYRFPDGLRSTKYFGIGLSEYLKPERLILIGTSSSMWDVFFDHQTEEHNDFELLELIEAAGENRVSDAMLVSHAKRLTEKLGFRVECVLIDDARTTGAQIDLLTRLASHLSPGESIELDVTHSYRHLPMLALVASRFLSRVKQINVNNIWYGALDMRDPETDETPVVSLKGMLEMLDWVDALASYDRNGDYGVFASLLQTSGDTAAAQQLIKASFEERINRPSEAYRPLRNFLQRVQESHSALVKLFWPELQQRLHWAEQSSYGERQLDLARQFLRSGDYLRSATQGFEAAITFHIPAGVGWDAMAHSVREAAKDHLEMEIPNPRRRTEAQQAYLDLRDLRNALAHGSRTNTATIQSALSSEDALKTFLDRCLSCVERLQN